MGRLRLALGFGFALLLPPSGRADVPNSMCLQGFLEDLDGSSVSGLVTFDVCLFDAPAGGTQVWPPEPGECASIDVMVDAGLFSLTFGDLNLDPAVFRTPDGPQPRWLQLSTGGQVMEPRIELRSVPYAFRTGFVDNPELTDQLILGSFPPSGPAGSLLVLNDSGGTSAFISSEPTAELCLTNGAVPAAFATACLSGGDAGQLSLAAVVGDENQARITLDASNGGGAELSLRNSNGVTTSRVFNAQGFGQQQPPYGRLEMYTGDGTYALTLFAEPAVANGAGGALHLTNAVGSSPPNTFVVQGYDCCGGSGPDPGSRLMMFNGGSMTGPPDATVTLDANHMGLGSGYFSLRNGQSPNSWETIALDGSACYAGACQGELRLSRGDTGALVARLRVNHSVDDSAQGGGELSLLDKTGRSMSYLGLDLTGPSQEVAGALYLFNGAPDPENRITVNVSGNSSDGGGRVFLANSSGGTTIDLRGGTGNACFGGIVSSANGMVVSNGAACDVAEAFEHTDSAAVQPGLVMAIDADAPGRLRISDRAYDRRVAGIISGAGDLKPGVKLGQRADGSDDHPVALSGRVYCWVDATEHCVDPGDLLTTSDTPGHAMKAVDRARAFGAVIGKAMTPLVKGQKGLVLVLVALQ